MRTRKQYGSSIVCGVPARRVRDGYRTNARTANGPTIPPVALTGGGSPLPTPAPTPGARDRASQWNMELLGDNDLQG